ncbi:glycosyltransferase family 4 protein, partial [Enterobacter hormaechei]
PPNVEAAASLATLAAEMPEADVVIAGGVSSAIPEGPPNLIRAGLLDPAAKADLLARASLFLDPVATGSGTSLKALEVAACGLPCL